VENLSKPVKIPYKNGNYDFIWKLYTENLALLKTSDLILDPSAQNSKIAVVSKASEAFFGLISFKLLKLNCKSDF
jgi:hypothetical protein